MKKMISNIKTLAALLMAGAAFTACSSDDNIIEQSKNLTEPQVYTMVIKASKGGDTTTRALQPGTDSETGKPTVDAYWSGDETIEVYQNGEKIGEATAAPSTDGNTTVTATLTSAPVPSNDLNFYLGGYNNVYTGQNGLLTGTNSISEKYDYAESLIHSGAYTVESYDVIPGEFTTLSFTDGITKQAIIKFTLKDKANDAAISPSALTVTDGTSTVSLTSIPGSTYTANGDGVLYVAFPASGMAKTITLTAAVGDDYYAYTTSSAKTFTNGKYYEITVKMTKNENARPLTLEAIEDGTITVKFCNGLTLPEPITYTKNGGAGVDITSTTNIPVSVGDKVCLYSKNSALGYYTEEDGTRDDHYINIQTSNRCYIYGNVMSLIDDSGSGFANDKVIADNTAEKHTTFYGLFDNAQLLKNHPTKPILLPATTLARECYSEMFSGCTSLTNAPALPAQTLADGCYGAMFSECTSLTTAPELPATTLADNCYVAMFAECTSLTTAPELPATTLADGCYSMMFQGCTSLTNSPALPATTLAGYCYSMMFQDCTNLTTVPATLPATTLAYYCYQEMFSGCTSLTNAPALPAPTLAVGCYSMMFQGCTNLNYVKCLATDISAYDCLDEWLDDVSATGTFVMASGATWPVAGTNGIPSGWTVQNAE